VAGVGGYVGLRLANRSRVACLGPAIP
jgi:hypothetical protein